MARNSIDDSELLLHGGRFFTEMDEETKQVRMIFVWDDVYLAMEFHDKLVHHLKQKRDLLLQLGPPAKGPVK